MAFVWSQVRFTTPTGVMVNTFAFNTTNYVTYPSHSDAVAAALTTFYNSSGIGANMATWVARAYEIRNYNPLDGKPRVPTIYGVTLPANTAGTTVNVIPGDVSQCLSFHGAPPITRRKRGRIFLGGVTSNWMATPDASSYPRFITTLNGQTQAAINAMTTLAASTVGWCIYSRAGGTYAPVVGGYVDSEPDTQRRRGNTASSRVTWGV
jgi:hypothetical protein